MGEDLVVKLRPKSLINSNSNRETYTNYEKNLEFHTPNST